MERICPNDNMLTIPVSLAITPSDLPTGSVVAGRYRVDERLGIGGMAKVYRATQMSMQRPVALKIVKPALLHDSDAIKRFYREARAASHLSHPNIVNLHDFGIDDETRMPFIAMELINGLSVGKILTDAGRLDEKRACTLLAQVARALVEAHAKGVVHRDLKPDNIMVSTHADGTEHVTVLDFGIAKLARKSNDDGTDSLTASGVAVGTPRYMAPEQVRGADVDYRADLYALGCILHEVLSGGAPYDAKKPAAIMLKHVSEPAPILPEGVGSPGVRALHASLLKKDPDERPKTTADVARILSNLAANAKSSSGTTDTFVAATVPSAPTIGRRARSLRSGALAVLLLAVLLVPVYSMFAVWAPGGDRAGALSAPPEAVPAGARQPSLAQPPAPAASTKSQARSKTAIPAAKTPTAKVVPAAEPAPDRGPARLMVGVSSVPPGAYVFEGRAELGQTPVEVSVGSTPRRVTLRLRGYKTEAVTLTSAHVRGVNVTLQRLKRADDFPPLAPR